MSGDSDERGHPWIDRSVWLPYDPPGRRGRFAYPGRCWEVRWRDRLGWWLFCLVATPDHTAVVWRNFRSTRKASRTEWWFGDEGTESSSEPHEPDWAGSWKTHEDPYKAALSTSREAPDGR